MKKLKMAYESSKPKKRSSSVLPLKYRNKTSNEKKRIFSNNYRPPKINENFYINNNI